MKQHIKLLLKNIGLKSNKKLVALIVIALLIVLAGIICITVNKPYLSNMPGIQSQIDHEAVVSISGQEINVEVAESSAEKARGLSGKTRLAKNEGMIFVFPQKTYPSFWMKDMNFPIDIIWISDGVIVHIDENVPPPSPDQKNENLPLYRPPKAIEYVLEVVGGYTQKHGIGVGDKVDIRL